MRKGISGHAFALTVSVFSGHDFDGGALNAFGERRIQKRSDVFHSVGRLRGRGAAADGKVSFNGAVNTDKKQNNNDSQYADTVFHVISRI